MRCYVVLYGVLDSRCHVIDAFPILMLCACPSLYLLLLSRLCVLVCVFRGVLFRSLACLLLSASITRV